MNTPQRSFRGNYILGHFLQVADANGEIVSRNPGDLDAPSIKIPFTYEHVHEAVVAAQRGCATWRRLTLSDRLSAVSQYRNGLAAQTERLASLVSFETGKPYWEALDEMRETLSIVDYFLKSAQKAPLDTPGTEEGSGFATRVSHHPRGVVAIVSPGISPVSDSHLHLVPALIFGNTVVFKASRHAPLVGQALAEIAHESQIPAGVFNLIQGDAEVSRRLVSHPEIQVVLYTGSYETGLKIKKQVVSDFWKITVLDMVGKNGVLIWDDCNYAQALHETVYSAFLTTGQRRTTASRILVNRKILDRFQADFHSLAKKASVGYGYTPSADAPFLGPLLNDEAVENYIRYQGIAVREGCEEIMRGKSLERNPKGHYVSPSIHRVTKPDPKSVYQKSEIFGPNVALYPVDDIEEAVEILNLSQHGLVASVYSKSRALFQRACDSVRVGTMHWNRPTHAPTFQLPRGGLKKSGNSRALGSLAWQQCTYPVSATEREQGWQASELPPSLPRGEV